MPSGHRFTFNGKETDNEVYRTGNLYDYGFRIYNPRLGKFLSVDPLTKEYPWYTPYQFAGNKPIIAIDLDGLEEAIVTYTYDKKGRVTKIVVSRFVDGDGNPIDMGLVDDKGNRLSTSNVLVIHHYSDGTEKIEEQDQLTAEQQKVLDDNLTINSQIDKTYKYKDYHGVEVPEGGQMEFGIQKFTYEQEISSKILFNGGEATFKDKNAANKEIKSIAKDFKDNGIGKLNILGNVYAPGGKWTDNTTSGSYKTNKDLALARADALKRALIKEGVKKEQISTTSGHMKSRTATFSYKKQDN